MKRIFGESLTDYGERMAETGIRDPAMNTASVIYSKIAG